MEGGGQGDGAAHPERELVRRRRIANGGCRKDASLWSRLPDDIMWRVLGFLPPTKRFQLHCKSRQWQRVLTSSHFRDTIAMAAPAAPADSEQQPQRQQGVVACVTPFPGYRSDNPRASSSGGGSARSGGRKVKKAAAVVDVDLAAFVPAWFWKPPHKKGCRSAYPYYDVVAAGDGLVCISNKTDTLWSWCDCDPEGVAVAAAAAAATDRYYCVLNPATRTHVRGAAAGAHAQPLLSVGLSAAALTLHMWEDVGGGYWEMKTATCDLPGGARPVAGAGAGASGGGPRWTEVRKAAVPWPRPRGCWPPDVTAECGDGDTFWYHAGRVHLLATSGGGGGGALDAAVVDTVDGPSVALQGQDAAATRYDDKGEVFLVAHCGTILLVAQLMRRGLTGAAAGDAHTPTSSSMRGLEAVTGVWRLARRQKTVWEPVSRLDMWRVKRLLQSGPLALGAGERGGSGGGGGGLQLVAAGDVVVSGACVVQDLLCCQFRIRSSCNSTRSLLSGGFEFLHGFVLGLDLDAGHGGGWELVAVDQALVHVSSRLFHAQERRSG